MPNGNKILKLSKYVLISAATLLLEALLFFFFYCSTYEIQLYTQSSLILKTLPTNSEAGTCSRAVNCNIFDTITSFQYFSYFFFFYLIFALENLKNKSSYKCEKRLIILKPCNK